MSFDQFQDVNIRWRYSFFLVLLLVAVCALVYRAIDLHVFEQAFLAEQGDARTIRFERLEAHRGMITDRHGEPLAVSAPVETVYADPKFLNLSLAEIKRLSIALDVSSSWLSKKIASNKNKRFIYLKRKMSPHEVKNVLSLNLDGIYSQREYKRYYPAGEVASHVLGFTSIDGEGQEGPALG